MPGAMMMMMMMIDLLLLICLPQSLQTKLDQYVCKTTSSGSANCYWNFPCSANKLPDIADEEQAVENDPDVIQDTQRSLRSIIRECKSTERYMKKMLDEYIKKRFVSEQEAKTIEESCQWQLAFNPKLRSNSLTDVTLRQLILFGFEDFMKFAIVMIKIEADEGNADNAVNFDEQFDTIERSMQSLICYFAVFTQYRKIPTPNELKEVVRDVELVKFETKAIQHNRDLVNLRSLYLTFEPTVAALRRFCGENYCD